MPAFVGPPEPAGPAQALRSWQQSEEERGLGAGWKYGPLGASLFDAWTTQDALSRGGQEANPIMAPFAENSALMYGVKGATGLGIGLLADRIAKSGHPNAARILAGFGIAVPLGAGAVNLAGGR